MTKEERKRLTEFLGECWHEIEETEYGDFQCRKCQIEIKKRVCNRTFTTPADQHAVFKKLVEVGKWRLFANEGIDFSPAGICFDWEFYQWLWIEPERFCKLVSQYLKTVVKGDCLEIMPPFMGEKIMKCCDCGKTLTKEEERHNEEIAVKSGTEKLDMCGNCWAEYCHHAETGE